MLGECLCLRLLIGFCKFFEACFVFFGQSNCSGRAGFSLRQGAAVTAMSVNTMLLEMWKILGCVIE